MLKRSIEQSEIIKMIIADCKENQGMWVAYLFLRMSVVAIAALVVWGFVLSARLANYMISIDSSWNHDNPIMLVAIILVPALGYGLLQEVHGLYREIRKIIKKGNR